MIPSKRSHLHVAAITHPGMRGKNNEDQFAASAFRLGESNPTPSVLAIISDGIGGHRAGEIASEMAVETISRIVAESEGTSPRLILEDAVAQASKKIFQQAESNQAQHGMGATCVVAWVIGSRLYSVAVGDSRLYLLRGNTITQLTTDHTWIQEAVDYGALTPEQARKHPNAHIIRRYLGSPNPPEPDFRMRLNPNETNAQAESNQGFQLITGDILVLCSDGLTDLVEKGEILNEFRAHSREKALDNLTSLANQRGGHDNITIIAMEVPGGMEKTRISQSRPILRRRLLVWIILLVLAALILIGTVLTVASYYFYSTAPEVTPTFTPTSPTTWTVLPPTRTLTDTPIPATATISPPTSTPPPQFTLTSWPTNTSVPP